MLLFIFLLQTSADVSKSSTDINTIQTSGLF